MITVKVIIPLKSSIFYIKFGSSTASQLISVFTLCYHFLTAIGTKVLYQLMKINQESRKFVYWKWYNCKNSSNKFCGKKMKQKIKQS